MLLYFKKSNKNQIMVAENNILNLVDRMIEKQRFFIKKFYYQIL